MNVQIEFLKYPADPGGVFRGDIAVDQHFFRFNIRENGALIRSDDAFEAERFGAGKNGSVHAPGADSESAACRYISGNGGFCLLRDRTVGAKKSAVKIRNNQRIVYFVHLYSFSSK